MFLSGYSHYVRTAASLQWDEAAVDLTADAAAWRSLPARERDVLLILLAGFSVGERAVARDLEPFGHASPTPDVGLCFAAQARDEERHARFFDRVAAEVARVPGDDAEARGAALAQRAPFGLVDLFERRLPAAARRLATVPGDLPAAVALYHVIIEGVVFTAGQLALRDLTRAHGLAGIGSGVERVLLDERWHVGFGASLLAHEDAGAGDVRGALDEAGPALAAWGDAVPASTGARVMQMHRRRIAAAGLLTMEVPA